MDNPSIRFQSGLAKFGSSHSQKRVEDSRLTTGKGQYSDDRVFLNEAVLVVLRSPHAHARIRGIETGSALAAPGVYAVLTHDDLRHADVKPIPVPKGFPGLIGNTMRLPPRFPLAEGTVRHVGQPVAAVVAQTRAQALDALELITVDWEPMPAVVDDRRALEPEAPEVWPDAPGNIAGEMRYGDQAIVDEAFQRARHVTTIELLNQRVVVNALEPRCSIATYQDGKTTLYTQNQLPTSIRDSLAVVFGGQPEDYRIVVGDIGGGFGSKTDLAQEEALVCFAARLVRRPVRWRAERSEEFLNVGMGRDQRFRASLALDDDGRILAMRSESWGNLGAVTIRSSAFIPLVVGPKVQSSVYAIPAIDYHIHAVLTHTTPTGAYRGAGRPEANFITERLLDKAARELHLDPADLRRRNLIPETSFPYRTPIGEIYDSGDFARILDAALELGRWNSFEARRQESRARGRLRGRGLAMYLEWTGGALTEKVRLDIDSAGVITALVGTQAIGQGLETTVCQLVAEILEIPISRITVVQGDTDRVTGGGAVGSRTAFVGGSAVVSAGHRMIERGRELAVDALEAPPGDIGYSAGRFSVSGTDLGIDWAHLAARQPGGHILVSVTENPSAPSWPNGTEVCEVEVDPETGEVAVVAFASVDDIGRVINRTIAAGQVHGGIAQGIGQALLEQSVYDGESGQLVTGSFMDYVMPRATDIPFIQNDFDESQPCQTNLLGAKGVGEIGTIGSSAAVVHAVIDALGEFGVCHIDMPITSEKVWRITHSQ